MIRFSSTILALIVTICCCDDGLIKDEGSLLTRSPIETVFLGESIEEIVSTFREVKDYQDLLSIVGIRDYKNQTIIQKLDFGMSLIQENVYTENDFRIRLKYLVHENNIGYGIIASIDSSYHSLAEDVLFHEDSSLLQSYVNDHNNWYGSEYNEYQLKEELIENSMELRIACGNATNSYGMTEIRLFRAVKNNDYEFINRMLKSVSPERQALGVIGVNKMIDTGKEISLEMAQTKEYILRKNPLVLACFSCTNGVYSLTDYLSKYYWGQVPNIDLK